jgi:hypothetical protein
LGGRLIFSKFEDVAAGGITVSASCQRDLRNAAAKARKMSHEELTTDKFKKRGPAPDFFLEFTRKFLEYPKMKLGNTFKLIARRSIHQGVTMPALFAVVLLSPTASRGIQVTQSQFSPSDPVITFATGTTALPTIPGVSFSGGDASFSDGGFGPQYFGNLVSGSYSYLDISFAQPQQAVGANLIKVTPAMTGVTEVVFDQNGSVIESDSANFSAGFLGIGETSADISRVEWQYSSPGFFGVGDVTYGGATVVPEPSTLALLATAWALFAFRRAAISGVCALKIKRSIV